MRRLVVILLALFVAGAPALAQDGVQMSINLPAAAAPNEGPSVSSAHLLTSKTRELLLNGFPAALHYRLELWHQGRWFDDPESATEWDVIVYYDPVLHVYHAGRQHGRQYEDFGAFGSLTSAEGAIDREYRVSLAPKQRGASYYYVLSLMVQTLTESDLDALQRWLRGDFEPAVKGQNNPVSAIRNGVGTLLSRILGGDKREYVQRSKSFRG